MNAKEISRMIFEIAVRLLGLLFLYHVLNMAPGLFTAFFAMHKPSGSEAMFFTFLNTAWQAGLAYYFLTGAPHLIKIVYPGKEKAPEENSLSKD